MSPLQMVPKQRCLQTSGAVHLEQHVATSVAISNSFGAAAPRINIPFKEPSAGVKWFQTAALRPRTEAHLCCTRARAMSQSINIQQRTGVPPCVAVQCSDEGSTVSLSCRPVRADRRLLHPTSPRVAGAARRAKRRALWRHKATTKRSPRKYAPD